jgi:hypothetical protein
VGNDRSGLVLIAGSRVEPPASIDVDPPSSMHEVVGLVRFHKLGLDRVLLSRDVTALGVVNRTGTRLIWLLLLEVGIEVGQIPLAIPSIVLRALLVSIGIHMVHLFLVCFKRRAGTLVLLFV